MDENDILAPRFVFILQIPQVRIRFFPLTQNISQILTCLTLSSANKINSSSYMFRRFPEVGISGRLIMCRHLSRMCIKVNIAMGRVVEQVRKLRCSFFFACIAPRTVPVCPDLYWCVWFNAHAGHHQHSHGDANWTRRLDRDDPYTIQRYVRVARGLCSCWMGCREFASIYNSMHDLCWASIHIVMLANSCSCARIEKLAGLVELCFMADWNQHKRIVGALALKRICEGGRTYSVAQSCKDAPRESRSNNFALHDRIIAHAEWSRLSFYVLQCGAAAQI